MEIAIIKLKLGDVIMYRNNWRYNGEIAVCHTYNADSCILTLKTMRNTFDSWQVSDMNDVEALELGFIVISKKLSDIEKLMWGINDNL